MNLLYDRSVAYVYFVVLESPNAEYQHKQEA